MVIVILHAHIRKTYIQKIHTAYNERDIIIVSYAYSKMPSIHIYTTITHATKHQTSRTHTQRARTHTHTHTCGRAFYFSYTLLLFAKHRKHSKTVLKHTYFDQTESHQCSDSVN